MKKSYLYTALLFLAAMIWGASFVAQSVGMDYVGPYTFMGVRTTLGAVALLPLIAALERKKPREERRALLPLRKDRTLLRGGLACGFFMALGCDLQQNALLYTTAGKCGFITTFYVMFVPILSVFLLRRRYRAMTWIGVCVAMVGFYLLCIKEDLTIGRGELLSFLCAVAYSFHILCVDYFVARCDGVRLSCLQFFVCGAISLLLMVLFEEVSLYSIRGALIPILYAGILSCGVGYTLQVICQKKVEPTLASLVMCLESVFSAIFGWLILHERLSVRELLGCAITFLAVILVQLAPEPTSAK